MKDITYDPTELQLNSYEQIDINNIEIEELSNNPQAIKMLYQHIIINLYDLKATKHELSENKKKSNKLNQDRENLRIQIAGMGNTIGVDMASILISFLGGFAINLLTNDWANGIGWVIFVLCISILFFFKYPIISNSISEIKKNKEHA